MISLFWNRLAQVTGFTVHAKQNRQLNFGRGSVVITHVSSEVLIYDEKGTWGISNFTNKLRWTIDNNNAMISLEHLRYGVNNPVFLIHFIADKESLVSPVPHICANDRYCGKVILNNSSFHLIWTIKGPKKNEILDFFYF